MGQIFYACAYDIENKICFTIDCDKFHANCYSYSGAVLSIHYLLRQKPYRVMWGGDYIVIDDALENVSRDEDLFGISTYTSLDDFECNNSDIEEKNYYDKIKFIEEAHNLWNRINIRNDAMKYFDWENTHSVKYSGFLVNHTKKLAINLKDYFESSKHYTSDGENLMAIDLIPVLTETGGGTGMALFDGIPTDCTEALAETWCGDLLQIVDDLPHAYEPIDCCFCTIWEKAKYCYNTFGTDSNGYLLNDDKGNLFKGTRLNMFGKRGLPSYINVAKDIDSIRFKSVMIEDYH